MALPTEHAARLALRTQQVIAEETGVVHVADPLGGSWFVEELTDEMERQAEEIFTHVEGAGFGLHARRRLRLHRGRLVHRRDRRSLVRFQSKVAQGEWIQVGVNGYTEGDNPPPPTLYIDPGVETQQLASLAAVKRTATTTRCGGLWLGCARGVDPEMNLMPALIEAAGAASPWASR